MLKAVAPRPSLRMPRDIHTRPRTTQWRTAAASGDVMVTNPIGREFTAPRAVTVFPCPSSSATWKVQAPALEIPSCKYRSCSLDRFVSCDRIDHCINQSCLYLTPSRTYPFLDGHYPALKTSSKNSLILSCASATTSGLYIGVSEEKYLASSIGISNTCPAEGYT
jgi:hypothetical protein